MQERLECVGGRGVAPEICVVEHVPRVSCVRWEWSKVNRRMNREQVDSTRRDDLRMRHTRER